MGGNLLIPVVRRTKMPSSLAPKIPAIDEKWCPHCKTFKKKDQFIGGYCGPCRRAYNREWDRTRRHVPFSRNTGIH